MYVCICNAVSENDIRRQAEDGMRSFGQLQERTGCATCCGCCESQAHKIFSDAIRDVRTAIPLTVAA